jgi:hypothetical protein
VRAQISKYFAIFGEVTWTQTRDNATGNALPGQPELVAFVRPEVHSGELSKQVSDLLLFFEVTHLGESFANPGNLAVIPARTPMSLGLGALFFESRLGLGFRVDDLLDVRGQDLLGFPVPGRRFSGRVSFRHEF